MEIHEDAEKLRELQLGRSKLFPDGPSKGKTAARKAAKFAQRKSFAELLAEANAEAEREKADSKVEVSITRAADGVPLARVILPKQKKVEAASTKAPAPAPAPTSHRSKRPAADKGAAKTGPPPKKPKTIAAAATAAERAAAEEAAAAEGSSPEESGPESLDEEREPGRAEEALPEPTDNGLAPWSSFADLPKHVPAPIVSLMTKNMGFINPTPIQAQAWPVILSGRDVVAVAITGSGKTLGYLVPAFSLLFAERGGGGDSAGPATASVIEVEESFRNPEVTWAQALPRVLVLAPTRELVQQIATEAGRLAAATASRVCTVYGGGPKAEQAKALREGAEVVVATPGRLQELLAVGPPPASWRPCVTVRDTHTVVLDEADRMLDMGFEPQITRIMKQCPKGETASKLKSKQGKRRRQTLMFTATWPPDVQRVANVFTNPKLASIIRVTQGGTCGANAGGRHRFAANKNIRQKVYCLPDDPAKERKLVDVLQADAGLQPGGESRMIIFVGTRYRCDQLHASLDKSGLVKSVPIHGDRTQVTTVLVFDFPPEFLQYVHRIGRTGRAGATGNAICFFSRENRKHAPALLQLIQDAGSAAPLELVTLAKEVEKNPQPLEKKKRATFVDRRNSKVVTGHNRKRDKHKHHKGNKRMPVNAV